MGFNDLQNTGLVLGLGLSVESFNASKKQANNDDQKLQDVNHHIIGCKLFLSDHHQTQPSLTLSLSGDHHHQQQQTRSVVKDVGDHSDLRNKSVTVLNNDQLSGDLSAASSLSNVSSVKGEREVVVIGSEDLEIEKVSSIRGVINDEDDDGSNGRKKLRLTKAQSALLEESFKHHSTLNPKQKQDLARDLKLRPRQVEVWFQNRRARTKLKQTEVDLEFLKKCCETLTEENRRLQKEVKALKLAQPLYMQLPAATLTMCPSCERIGGGSGGVSGGEAAKGPFAAALKPRLYNPFASPSSAC